MWIGFDSPAVRLTGRWGVLDGNRAVATAAGAYLEAAFYGELATLRFDMEGTAHPVPHVWISVDGGARRKPPWLRICGSWRRGRVPIRCV